MGGSESRGRERECGTGQGTCRVYEGLSALRLGGTSGRNLSDEMPWLIDSNIILFVFQKKMIHFSMHFI